MKKKNVIILTVCMLTVCVIVTIICKKDSLNIFGAYDSGEQEPRDASVYEDAAEDDYSDIEIPIYTINYDMMECEPSVIVVPDKKTVDERYIVDEVIANFREHVNIYDIVKDGENVIVSFARGSAPACNVSKDMEAVMLDCIAYSLIDNVNNCNGIIFRIEGAEYKGVNIATAYDETYITQ